MDYKLLLLVSDNGGMTNGSSPHIAPPIDAVLKTGVCEKGIGMPLLKEAGWKNNLIMFSFLWNNGLLSF